MPVNGGGGGGGSNDIRAGGAFFEIFGKENLSNLLGKLQDKVKRFQTAVTSIKTNAFTGGFLGGLVGGSDFVQAFKEMAHAGAEWAVGLRQAEAALAAAKEKASQLNVELAKLQDRRLADLTEKLMALSGNPAEAIGRIQAELKGLSKELKGVSDHGEQARSALAQMNQGSWSNFKEWIGQSRGIRLEELGDSIKESDTAAGKLRDTITKLRIELAKLRRPGPDLLLSGDLAKSLGEVDFANSTRNMTDYQKKVQEFRDRESKHLRNGGKDVTDQIAELEHRAKQFEFNTAFDEQQKAFNELKQQLEDTIEFADRTGDEISVLKMEREARRLKDEGKAGISDEQSDQLRKLLPGRLPPFLSVPLNLALGLLPELAKAASEVKVATRGSVQTLGYGDTAQRLMLSFQEKIAQNTEPDRLGQALASELRLR